MGVINTHQTSGSVEEKHLCPYTVVIFTHKMHHACSKYLFSVLQELGLSGASHNVTFIFRNLSQSQTIML